MTLSDIGMMAQRRSRNLKKLIRIDPLKPDKATMPILITIKNKNKNFESLFISRSSLPTFVTASLAFIWDLVSIPV